MERIKEVFRMHGASAMASSDLGFVPADFPADAVSLLAPCGDLWGLRYDLRYPFASWLAHQAALLNAGKPVAHIQDTKSKVAGAFVLPMCTTQQTSLCIEHIKHISMQNKEAVSFESCVSVLLEWYHCHCSL